MVTPPAQARSRRNLARIVAASHAAIAERGRDGLTVQDVVARARTSVGSFYARFPSRESLLLYLDEETAVSARERWDEALASRMATDADLGARLRSLVEMLVGDPGDGTTEVDHHRWATASAAVMERRREIHHPRPERAVELGWAAVLGVARAVPDGWERGPLVEELTRLWQVYLQSGADQAADPGGVDFFQVWT